MKSALSLLAIPLLLAGCGTVGPIKGKFLDTNGAGVADVEVVFWRGSLLALFFPVLPERVAKTTTDANGRFETYAPKRVYFVTARGNGHGGSRDLGWFVPNEIVIQELPLQHPDYSYTNSKRLPSDKLAISVSVVGQVQKPGIYLLTRNDSVWKAIEAAGGLLPTAKSWVDLRRIGTEGPMRIIYPLDWSRRTEDKIPPFLGDGDIVAVDVSLLKDG